jgi:ABC-type multidrug transport system ATPase subunit
MLIRLNNIGKRFDRQWIFRHVEVNLQDNSSIAILGSNGSGKSTLLRIISGRLLPTEGSIIFSHKASEITSDSIYKHITYAAPYLDLPGEFNLEEMLSFHTRFKPLINGISCDDFFLHAQLGPHRKKLIQDLSSGMKQRLKLSLALLSSSSVVLLDEPCTNLDEAATKWYAGLLKSYSTNRCIIICSNHKPEETFMCNHQLLIDSFSGKTKEGNERGEIHP